MENMMKVLCLIFMFSVAYSYGQANATNIDKQYKDSTINSVGTLINGKKHGAWIYYRNGSVVRTSYFNQDTLCKVTVYFNKEGGLLRVVPFEHGLVSGNVKFYSKEGELIAVYEYKNDGFIRALFRKATVEGPANGHDYYPMDDNNEY